MAARTTPLTVALADIDVSNRVRPLNEADAELIAQTIRAHNASAQEALVSLRHTPNGAFKWVLISGRHRLRALELCDITELVEGIHFKRVDADPTEARLLEIEENLARADTTLFGRAVMLVAYRDALGLDGRGGDRRSDEFKTVKSGGFEKSARGFMAKAMEVFDLQLREAERLLQIGRALTQPAGLADRLHFSKIARNQSQLLKLAALAPENLERGAEAFDAAQGDFHNLMAILEQAPARQATMLEELQAGAPLDELVEVTRPLRPPAFDYHNQALSSYASLSHAARIDVTVRHFATDEKAVRKALRHLGYELVKIEKTGSKQ